MFRYLDIYAPVVDEAALVLHGLAAAGLLPELLLLHGAVPHVDVGHRAFNGIIMMLETVSGHMPM